MENLSDSEIESLDQVFQDQFLIGNFFNENKISYDRAMRALVILFGNLVYQKKIDEEDLRVFHSQILGFSEISKKASVEEIN